MTEINHHLRTVKEALSNTYQVPFYQRDYRWKRRQFEELLIDLEEEFLSQFDSNHGRDKVAQYKSYFLGTMLTTRDPETSRKIIIDGQQRLTSLTLLFIFSIRQKNTYPDLNITNFQELVRRESYGTSVLNFSADEERAKLVNALIDSDDVEESDTFDFVDRADQGTKNALQRFRDIYDILDEDILTKHFAYFADWISEKVVIFEIVVPTEHEAHKVFVTMNDRGLNLTPSEMLKGFLLSRITNPQKHSEAHTLWNDRVRKLREIDTEEDSNFIRTWLRAKYAVTLRSTKKDESKKDFEMIGDSYHRWLHENKERVGLDNDDSFQRFVLDNFKKYSDVYLKIQKYSLEYNENYRHVFYNSSKDVTLQNMLILSSIKLEDTDSVVDLKIKLLSKYVDYYVTARIISLKRNTYDVLRDPFFSLTIEIRDKDETEIKQILHNHSRKSGINILDIESFVYGKAQTKNILHVLARIASYLEEGVEQTNSVGFPDYIDRKRNSKTFDIEHVLAENYPQNKKTDQTDFQSASEYKELRDSLGGLILLPRSRNRSLKDKPYNEKINKYNNENILAQSLCSDFYENNPQVNRFIEKSGLNMKPYDHFDRENLLDRHKFYLEVISKIWSIADITGVDNLADAE